MHDYETWRKECAEIMNTEFYMDKEKSMSMLGIIYSILLRDTHLQNKANYLLQSNKYEQADRVFDEILRITPDSIFALLGKGNVAVKKQNYDDVIKYFENVIELDSQKTNVVAKDLGAAYWVEGNKAKNEQKYLFATDCLTKAMFYDAENTAKAEPVLEETYCLQAASELDATDYIAAKKSITSAMQYTHDNKTLVRLLIKRAETNELLGAYANAMSDYDKALSIDNANIYIYEKRSLLCIRNKEYDAALHDCNAILGFDSNNVLAIYYKGIILEKQGDIFKAQDLVHEALRLNPEPELRRRMDIRLQAINIKIAEYYESCGDKYLMAKDYNNAYREYSKAIDTIPSNGKLFMKRGDTSRLLNNNENAKKDYEKAFVFLKDLDSATAEVIFQKIIPEADRISRQTWENDNVYRLSTIFPFKCFNCSNYNAETGSCSLMQVKKIFALTQMNARCHKYVKRPGTVFDE
ncbi:MAG: hypothetical protein LBK66_03625 [Spirochaetaceae bacterium]|nr:hypothetical protein [Spirochaetaceae bacterium]